MYNVIDETKVNAHKYRVEFLDTQLDAIDNNGNGLIDAADSTEWERYTTSYTVRDLQDYTEQFVSKDTALVYLKRKNIIGSSIVVVNPQGATVQSSNYVVDIGLGTIRGATPGSLPVANNAKYSITYQYYPVFRSPNIQKTPYLVESKDADIFDGVQLSFNNDWSIKLLNLDSLRFLSLANNTLTGSIPGPTPGDLPVLDFIDLSVNQLSGNIPGGMGNLPKLSSLSVRDNKLTGVITSDDVISMLRSKL